MKDLQRKQNNILRALYKLKKDENIDRIYREKRIKNITQLLLAQLSRKGWDIYKEGGVRGSIILEMKETEHNMMLRESTRSLLKEKNSKKLIGSRRPSVMLTRIINELERNLDIFAKEERSVYPKKKIEEYWSTRKKEDIEKVLYNSA